MLLGKANALLEADRAPTDLVEDTDATLAQRRLEHHLERVLKAEHDCRLAALIVQVVERGDHPAHRVDGLALEQARDPPKHACT